MNELILAMFLDSIKITRDINKLNEGILTSFSNKWILPDILELFRKWQNLLLS